jgi:hypothetical protein
MARLATANRFAQLMLDAIPEEEEAAAVAAQAAAPDAGGLDAARVRAVLEDPPRGAGAAAELRARCAAWCGAERLKSGEAWVVKALLEQIAASTGRSMGVPKMLGMLRAVLGFLSVPEVWADDEEM